MNYWDGGLFFWRQRPEHAANGSLDLKEKRPAGKVINGCNAKIIEKCLRYFRERVIDVHIEKMANR